MTRLRIILWIIFLLLWFIGDFLPILPWPLLSYLAVIFFQIADKNCFTTTQIIILWIFMALVTAVDYITPVIWTKIILSHFSLNQHRESNKHDYKLILLGYNKKTSTWIRMRIKYFNRHGNLKLKMKNVLLFKGGGPRSGGGFKNPSVLRTPPFKKGDKQKYSFLIFHC